MGKTYLVDLVVEERKKTSAKGLSPDKDPSQKESAQQGTEPCACADKSKSKQTVQRNTSDSDSDSEDECCNLEALEDNWRYPMYSPSASYRQVDVVSGSHQYTISGFPLARSMGCGTRLCSDFFEICGQLFRLEVYPGGFTADTRRFVSVFLTTPGTLNPNHIMYELAILDQSGKDRHIVEKRSSQGHSGFGGRGCHMFGPMLSCSRGVLAALPKFIKAKFLEEHHQRYMPCGMLVLRATVQVLRGWSSAPAVHGHMAYNGVGCRPMHPALNLLPRQYPGDAVSPYMPMQPQQLPLGYLPMSPPAGCSCGARHPLQQQYQSAWSAAPTATAQQTSSAQHYTGSPSIQASGAQQGMQFQSSQQSQGGMSAPHYSQSTPQFTPQSTPQSRAQMGPQQSMQQWYSPVQQQQPSATPQQQPAVQQQYTYQPVPQQYMQQRTAHGHMGTSQTQGDGGSGGGPAGPHLPPYTPVTLMRETDPRYLVYLASPSP